MGLYVAVSAGIVINILDAPTKEIAEEASCFSCVEYDHTFHPEIGDSYVDGVFTRRIVDEVVVE